MDKSSDEWLGSACPRESTFEEMAKVKNSDYWVLFFCWIQDVEKLVFILLTNIFSRSDVHNVNRAK